MSFTFTEAEKRQRLPGGLYGQPLDALALNLPNAATAGRLFVDLWVSNSSFVTAETALADLVIVSDLTALAGLAVHQAGGYTSKPISTVTPSDDDANNKVIMTPNPPAYSWASLAAASSGYSLEALGVRYSPTASATPNANDWMVYWHNGSGVTGTPMSGGDVNVSLPFLDSVRSIGD